MTDIGRAGTYRLGDREVNRMGYGAMRLTGPGIYGPPKDRDEAIAVLREAVASGINHIDTSDYYGPHVVNEIIREALSPYPDDLVIVTKLGARRTPDKAWHPAMSPEELRSGLEDNLRHLGLEAMEVVNLRFMGSGHGPSEGSIAREFEVLAELQRQGLIRHLGLSNVTTRQFDEAQRIAPVACVQNEYNLVHREDDELIVLLERDGHCLRAVLPSRRLHAAAVRRAVGHRGGGRRDADAGRARLAAAAVTQHLADPRHLVARAPAREPGGGGAGTVGRRAGTPRRDREGRRTGLTKPFMEQP